jgi:hypothetical protein
MEIPVSGVHLQDISRCCGKNCGFLWSSHINRFPEIPYKYMIFLIDFPCRKKHIFSKIRENPYTLAYIPLISY